jgi:hypothetical protein
LVEAIVAGMFLSMALRGPLASVRAAAGLAAVVSRSATWADWVVYGYDLTLLFGLLAVALMETDGAADRRLAVPRRWVAGLIMVGLAAPTLGQCVGFAAPRRPLSIGAAGIGLVAAGGHHLGGLAAGVLLALAVRASAARQTTARRQGQFATASLLLCGTFLGALPASALAAGAATGQLVATGLARTLDWSCPRLPWLLWVITFAGLLWWGPSIHRLPQSALWWQTLVVFATALALGMLSLGSRTIAHHECS